MMLFLSKICLPTVYDDLYILLNDRLYHLYLALLEAMIVDLRYFWYHVVLCFMAILELRSSLLPLGKADASIALLSLTRSRFNMNMNGFMVITIEFEDKSKKDKAVFISGKLKEFAKAKDIELKLRKK